MGAFWEFVPKSFTTFRAGYRAAVFKKDLLAGATVGVIALPLAMAFAIASGVTPDRGLFTAIVAGFLISALGGSRVQIGGPTGAFVVIVYDIIQRTGYEGLALSTLIAAVFLVLLGIFRLGSWIKYVPHPLIMGFTTGIAILIFSSQIKDFFGLEMAFVPANFMQKWIAYAHAFPSFDPATFLLGAGTLALILAIRRFAPYIPWGIAAIVIASLVCYFFDLPVETIQSKFGQIPRNLPWPSLPSLSIPEGKLPEIFMDAAAIAFLGAIESLLSAVIGDGMIGSRHKSNCELVGQGIANFASILFGGIPATGAIARTAANVKTGAQTPMAGMIHAATLFLILLFLAPIVSQIPLAALAAVLIMVAWNMSEVGHFIQLLKAPLGDRVVLLIAFLLTVFVDITAAITIGMIVACFLFMKKMSEFSKTVKLTELLKNSSVNGGDSPLRSGVASSLPQLTDSSAYSAVHGRDCASSCPFKEPTSEFPERSDPDAISKKTIPDGVEVYEIQGPFFFGAADMLKDVLLGLEKPPKIFILRMRHVSMIDASGMNALREFSHKCQRQKTLLLLSGVHGQTEKELHKFGLKNIFPHIDAALSNAKQYLN